MEENTAKTRFAPSPTGVLHIGGARTALFNWLFARQNGGKFVLRIEDTDKERSKKEHEDDIISGLKWLGLEWDEFYRQSERGEIYKKYIEKLLKSGGAYVSEEKKGESKKVIRFKNPNKKIKFSDIIRGEIEFDTTELGDFVIAKNEESPLFHLAVVIDDFEMGISHVIRGEDHISNTPRQILVQEAIGAPRPVYAHIPLILGEDRSKLSKRHGAESLAEFRKDGYLPEALVNFLTFLGWNPGDEREIFGIEELIKEFSIKKIQKSGAIFNIKRLNWINSHYLKKTDDKKLKKFFIEDVGRKDVEWGGTIDAIIRLEKERIEKLSEINELYKAGELDYFFKQPEYDAEKLLWRGEESRENAKLHLEKISELIEPIKDFTSQNIKDSVWDYAQEKGRGNVLWPFRVALTGLEKSPDPFSVAEVLGKEEAVKRLKYAIEKI